MNHEWTRMDTNVKGRGNHEKHEIHEKRGEGGEYEPRMDTNGHEWNHEIQEWNHEKHERHEKEGRGGRV